MVLAIANRASRRLARAVPLMEHAEELNETLRHTIERALQELTASGNERRKYGGRKNMLSRSQRTTILELHARE